MKTFQIVILREVNAKTGVRTGRILLSDKPVCSGIIPTLDAQELPLYAETTDMTHHDNWVTLAGIRNHFDIHPDVRLGKVKAKHVALETDALAEEHGSIRISKESGVDAKVNNYEFFSVDMYLDRDSTVGSEFALPLVGALNCNVKGINWTWWDMATSATAITARFSGLTATRVDQMFKTACLVSNLNNFKLTM